MRKSAHGTAFLKRAGQLLKARRKVPCAVASKQTVRKNSSAARLTAVTRCSSGFAAPYIPIIYRDRAGKASWVVPRPF